MNGDMKKFVRNALVNADDGTVVILAGMADSEQRSALDLISTDAGQSVHMVDLSQVVSKYIGETEKNLISAFVEASQEGWVLFFDEADALFGKRSIVGDAHDRYANIEVGYLRDLAVKYEVTAVVVLRDAGPIDAASPNILVVEVTD